MRSLESERGASFLSARLAENRDGQGLWTAFQTAMAGLEPFEPRPHLAVAVSGGADSLALMLLSFLWCQQRQGRVTILTVDHGLRAESRQEAETVGRHAKALGLTHEILTWEQGPETGRETGAKQNTPGQNTRGASLQEKARLARYALLETACQAHGCLHLLVGHHADDQEETVVMRAQAGSGPSGLAAMAAIRELRFVRLLRPLLAISKSQLESFLVALGYGWVQDPSNMDRRYWRGAFRQEETVTGRPGLSSARTYGILRQAEEKRRAAQAVTFVELQACGALWLTLAPFFALAFDDQKKILQDAIRHVSGAPYAPKGRKVAACLTQLQDAQGQNFSGSSLGGCLLQQKKERLLICRDSGIVTQDVFLKDLLTTEQLWDRRFALTIEDPEILDHILTPKEAPNSLATWRVKPISPVLYAQARRLAKGDSALHQRLARIGWSFPALYDSLGRCVALWGGGEAVCWDFVLSPGEMESGFLLLTENPLGATGPDWQASLSWLKTGKIRFSFCPQAPFLFSCFGLA